jgi:hypothetical protein
MSDTPANPVFVALLFILRCLVPVAVLFGISYLLRRLGLVAETPEPPGDYEDNGDDQSPPDIEKKKKEGDLTHGNT